MALNLAKEILAAERKIKEYSLKGQAIPKDLLDYYSNLLSVVAASVSGASPITPNIIRGVNNNTSVLQISPTTVTLNSIYVDNLHTSPIYLDLFQGLSALPVNGDTPFESYRLSSYGSISISFDRSYSGQLFLAFSSTAGNLTLDSNLRNYIVSFY